MLPFVKYQGTGNDFVMVDGREIEYPNLPVKEICDRRFGVGADGLMILQPKVGFDFEMVYYNSDGNLSSMCGNGGRCIAHWAHTLGLGKNGVLQFWAPDGAHEALVNKGIVELKMNDLTHCIRHSDNVMELNTGSPHYVEFTQNRVKDLDLYPWARGIRYNDVYAKAGINVNAVEVLNDHHIFMRTYERGVEDETLSCGTGVTAAALSHTLLHLDSPGTKIHRQIKVSTQGGELEVRFDQHETTIGNIWLIGPAKEVFVGNYPL